MFLTPKRNAQEVSNLRDSLRFAVIAASCSSMVAPALPINSTNCAVANSSLIRANQLLGLQNWK
jgi:hypothetical protein